MIRIHRPPEVAALGRSARSALTRRATTAASLPSGDPAILRHWANFLRSKPRREIEEALDRCFRGKCAYCESSLAADIEHYRPKSLYPRARFHWDNLLKGCKNCNNAKGDTFPLLADGRPRLLDPCVDEPLDYFLHDPKTGRIVPNPDPQRCERAEATLELLRLNQAGLCEARSKLRTLLWYLLLEVRQKPVSDGLRKVVRNLLSESSPYLAVIREAFHRPSDEERRILDAARAKLPELDEWTRPWL